jgi:hypothetical protein
MVFTTVPVMAQDECCEDAKACDQLMDECTSNLIACDEVVALCNDNLEDCLHDCKKCSWREMILDRKVQTAIIFVVTGVVTGITGAIIQAQSGK